MSECQTMTAQGERVLTEQEIALLKAACAAPLPTRPLSLDEQVAELRGHLLSLENVVSRLLGGKL